MVARFVLALLIAPVTAGAVSRSLDAANWQSEALNDASAVQLKKIEGWLTSRSSPEGQSLEAVIAESFGCPKLRSPGLQRQNRQGGIEVSKAPNTQDRMVFFGREGFVAAIGGWKSALAIKAGVDSRAKLKQFKIDEEEGGFATQVYVELSRSGKTGSVQANAIWHCRWLLTAAEEVRLASIEVTDYQETRFQGEGGRMFEDVTTAALGGNACFDAQILRGIDDWVPRITKLHRFWKFGWHGVTVGDVNGDGFDDIYMPEAGGLPNRLFLQEADGTLSDVSAEAGVDWLESTSAALFVDLDNDGDQDLVAASKPMTLFLENDGRGHFKMRTGLYVVEDPFSLSAADYDSDGDLDVYVCGYNREDSERNVVAPVPYHDANNGGRSVLFRNDGDFHFADASAECGLDANNNTRFSLASSWEDYDNDGDPDLYVANDYGRNNLYRNDGGKFTDVAGEMGVEDISSGMSITWGDHDRDGRMDAYVSNMFSAAGNRVTYQRKFAAQRAGGDLSEIQRMARGNSLFQNKPGGFLDVSADSGTIMGRWAWSSLFGDLNNDGWEDLAVANGFITSTDSGDL